MMLELVTELGRPHKTHAVYVAANWPVDSVNDKLTVCGLRTAAGWELINGHEPTCNTCGAILRGGFRTVADALTVPPPAPPVPPQRGRAEPLIHAGAFVAAPLRVTL